MIKSTTQPTHHLLVALNNYPLYPEDPNYLKYQFGYLNIVGIADQIKASTEELRIPSTLLLIEGESIFDNTHNDTPGYEHVKLDSITFLEETPQTDQTGTMKLPATLVLKSDYFFIESELIPEGMAVATILYRSARTGFDRFS